MSITVAFSEEPIRVLSGAGEFLASQPVLHNLILSILHARIARPEPGRYWVAMDRDEAVGLVLQSPMTFPATLTPMEPEVTAPLVDAIVESGVSLPGVNGHAATAASFAGQWTERCKSAATPFQGNRLYELLQGTAAPTVRGTFRPAGPRDRGLTIDWTNAFLTEVGEPAADTQLRVDRELAAGQLWLWVDGEPVSMAVGRAPVEGVVRLSEVYTPPDKRGRGYAAACVHALSAHLRDAAYRCILYTDLANPTSNSIYRRIGYRAVAEVLRYRFAEDLGGRLWRRIRGGARAQAILLSTVKSRALSVGRGSSGRALKQAAAEARSAERHSRARRGQGWRRRAADLARAARAHVAD